MSDRQKYSFRHRPQRAVDEFCNRPGFADDSEVDDLSDDEADPTYMPTPRINVFQEADESDDEGDADDSDEPTVPAHPATPVLLQPNVTWEVQDIYDPLPPAPPFEVDITHPDFVSTIDSFRRYVPDVVLQSMAEATRGNIFTATGKAISLTKEDMEKFFGISVMMSYLKFPRIRMYWAARTKVLDIVKAMPRDKYFIIRNYLRVRDYGEVSIEEKKHKYWKVQPFLKSIRDACLQNPRGDEVSIDEQMVPFWGHTEMRQHIKGKPNPCGLKNFVACAPDGLPLDFFLYEGKGDTIIREDELNYPGLDIGGKVIVRLSKDLPMGISIFMDRYFTSIPLIVELHLRGFQATGMLKNDRIPPNTSLYSDAEVRGGGRGYMSQAVRDDGQIAIVKWFDNKPVVLTSSVHGAHPTDKCRRWDKKEKRYIEVERPNIIKQYNAKMGGVDLLDRMISFYRLKARTKKWTVRLIFHMMDFVVASSWLMRRRYDDVENVPRKDRLDYLEYKTDLAYHLIHQPNQESDEEVMDFLPLPGPSRHVQIPLDVQRKHAAKHMPMIPDNKDHRCRFPGCDSKKARMQCSTCKVFLCLNSNRNCYKVFHEM